MKIRRRKATRKGKGVAAPSTPPIMPPPDLTTEIEQSVETRDKLKAGAAAAAEARGQLKRDFLRLFAGEMGAAPFDANRALDRFAYWQAQEERASRLGYALDQLSAMFVERVEQFKSNSKAESAVALRRIIERLAAERDRPGADKNAIDKRTERLLAEVESLREAPPVPPRPPKDKTAPAQRPAQRKPQPRESGEL